MAYSSFLSLLVISTLLLSFTPGWGRKVMPSSGSEDRAEPTVPLEENAGISREMIELDYAEAGPNVNTKAGFIPPPPSSSPVP